MKLRCVWIPPPKKFTGDDFTGHLTVGKTYACEAVGFGDCADKSYVKFLLYSDKSEWIIVPKKSMTPIEE